MVQIIKNQNNNYVIVLDHRNYKGRLIFGNTQDRITIISNSHRYPGIYFYGFRGFLRIPSLNTISEPSNPTILFNQAKPKNLVLKYNLNQVKKSLLKELTRIIDSPDGQEILQRYRQILINIVSDETYGSPLERFSLGQKIPVYLVGMGWKVIGELNDKKVYVEFNRKKMINPKSELASSMGFYIVRVRSKSELDLVKKLIGAQDLTSLPDFLLNGIKTVENPTQKELIFLKSANEVLNLMVSCSKQNGAHENLSTISTLRYMTNTQSNSHYRNNLQQSKLDVNIDIEKSLRYNDTILCNRNKNGGVEAKSTQEVSKDSIEKLTINNIKLSLCKLDRGDINALAHPGSNEIFMNLCSPIIQHILVQAPKVQKALLLEEISHELAHIYGYGLEIHDLAFYNKQRILKYKAILKL